MFFSLRGNKKIILGGETLWQISELETLANVLKEMKT